MISLFSFLTNKRQKYYHCFLPARDAYECGSLRVKKNVSASFPFAFLAVRPRNDVLILILCSLPFVPSTMAASTCSIFYFLRPDNYLWGALNFWYFIPRCEERCLQLFPLRNLVVLIWCMILATVRCVSWASRTLCLQFFVSSLCDRLSCKQDKTKAI